MPRVLNKPLQSLVIGLGGSGAVTIRHIKAQLENMYDQVPDNVGLIAFDTDIDPSAQHDNLALATLNAREFGHLGGNAKSIFERVAANDPNYEHFSGWLQADYYLRTQPDNMFQLHKGAGQWRQFGRMAIFRDVLNANDSNFYRLLQSRLSTLVNSEGGGLTRPLNVFVVGSLVGGTGAGTFIDAAHLARLIAASMRLSTVIVRGFFWLPDAFGATLDPTALEQAKPRAFAALRELSRFVINDDYISGYPMFYQNERFVSNSQIWRGHLRGKLFDLVYLMDGRRQQKPLSNVKTTIGVASSVADALLAFMDSHAGAYYESHSNNISNNITQRSEQVGRKPFVGSLGAYAIILPIQQIVEGWSYRLGLDVLNRFLPAEETERGTNRILTLAEEANPERAHSPSREVEIFLGNNPQRDPDQPENMAYPTGLWRRIYDWHQQKELDDSRKAAQMAKASAYDWVGAMRPNSQDRGERAGRVVGKIDNLMEKTVYTEVEDSKAARLDPREDNRRIIAATNAFYEKQLGRVMPNGMREGGEFRNALQDLANYQIDRFRLGLQYFLKAQLNGQDDKDPETGRAGKLGWTIAVITELEQVLDDGTRLIGMANSDQIAQRIRQQASEGQRAAEISMEDASRRSHRRDAAKAQEAFYSAATYQLDVYRAEVARTIVESVIRDMRNFVRDVLVKLRKWTNVLATHQDSLYSQFLTGEQRVISRRSADAAIVSRWTLDVEETRAWENQKYAQYSNAKDALRTAMRGMKWEILPTKNERGDEALGVNFSIGGEILRDDMQGEWWEQNARQLIRFCDDIFEDVKQRESLIQFLANDMFRDQAGRLAQLLLENAGAMLSFNEAGGEQFLKGFLLVANQSADDAPSRNFVNTLKEELATRMGVDSNNAASARLLDCDDPFRLSLVSTSELIALDTLTAYTSGEQPYLNAPGETRRTYHVFPAEVNAVRYEDKLPELRKSKRMFTPHVTTLVENIERFRIFLQLMAHRIIFEDRDPNNATGNEFVYFLGIEDENGELHPDDTIWLTKPAQEPSLMDAMDAFMIKQRDMGKDKYFPNHIQPIDDDKVEWQLDQTRQNDTKTRLEAGAEEYIGIYDANMYPWLTQFQPDTPQYNAMARAIVEYDVLRAFDEEFLAPRLEQLEHELEREIKGNSRSREETVRDLRDVFTIARLVVKEVLDAKNKDIRIQAGVR